MHTSVLLPAFLMQLVNKNRGIVNAVDGALDMMHGEAYARTKNVGKS